MKKRGLIAFLTIMMFMMSAIFANTDEAALKLVSTYPKDGQKNTSVENVGVKLRFNNAVSGKNIRENNLKALKIVNKKDGKKLATKVIFSEKDPGLVLVLGDNSDGKLKVENNAEYKLIIDKDFSDDNGNHLGEDKVLTFKTFNQKLNNTINMMLMFLMFGGIALFTMRQQKQQREAAKEDDSKAKNDTINPYKEAKKTGKSVEQIVAAEKKKEAKKKKAMKKDAQPEKTDKKHINIPELLPYVHHVKAPRPISAAGGKYKSGLSKS